jgi:hypothetical protein
MKHLIVIRLKKGEDLFDYYDSEEVAKAAIQSIAEATNPGAGSVVTPSGNVAFDAGNFAGAVYKGGGYDP